MKSNYLIHGGNILEESLRLGISSNNILDASASLVPFKLPKKIKKGLIKEISNNSLRSYPDTNYTILREEIGKWHNINPEMILPGNGASEIFTWAAKDAQITGESVLPSPNFSDHIRALKCQNAKYIEQEIALFDKNKTPKSFPIKTEDKVVWITNPHNPTGELWSKESIIEIIKANKLIICDEAFLPLSPEGENESVINLVTQYSNLIVIRSLTKLYSIAGLRLGYAITSKERVRRWKAWRDPWPVNKLAVEAGILIFKDKKETSKWLSKIHKWVLLEGQWFTQELNKIKGLRVHPSSANFFLIEGYSSLTFLREELAKKGILLRDCRSFAGLGENWLRVSLQNRAGNKEIISSIRSILN